MVSVRGPCIHRQSGRVDERPGARVDLPVEVFPVGGRERVAGVVAATSGVRLPDAAVIADGDPRLVEARRARLLEGGLRGGSVDKSSVYCVRVAADL